MLDAKEIEEISGGKCTHAYALVLLQEIRGGAQGRIVDRKKRIDRNLKNNRISPEVASCLKRRLNAQHNLIVSNSVNSKRSRKLLASLRFGS
jgi:hypothetical protein